MSFAHEHCLKKVDELARDLAAAREECEALKRWKERVQQATELTDTQAEIFALSGLVDRQQAEITALQRECERWRIENERWATDLATQTNAANTLRARVLELEKDRDKLEKIRGAAFDLAYRPNDLNYAQLHGLLCRAILEYDSIDAARAEEGRE